MTFKKLLNKLRKVSKKPPKVIIDRLLFEIRLLVGQYTTPMLIKIFSNKRFLKKIGIEDITILWEDLSRKPFFTVTTGISKEFILANSSKDYEQIILNAENSFQNTINLLGTGNIVLGEKIDWHKDYKTNIRWTPKYISKIKYSNPYDKSDVKVPWEISRMQWLIPLGQAYILTKDEKYANKVKDVIIDWINENPYAQSVNWACTMEAALRIFTWTWFFHVFKNSTSWSDRSFRFIFLKNLWLHGKFTEEHIEKSDINGNHFTADAAAMVIAGLFFNKGKDSKRWAELGWLYLEDEFPKQVFSDGVNYEASVPYHRLVLELFLFPALYRVVNGLCVSEEYSVRLKKMAWFSAVASKPNGIVPVWGDADDARALPFRFDAINDHRYIPAIVGLGLGEDYLINYFSGNITEILWLFGENKAQLLLNQVSADINSTKFEEGGFYILRDKSNHVFIDCGPIGLAGRGGHGHNDILSFEAYLNGCSIIVDSGSYLYTADYSERNNFRSTRYHNTPQINDVEINRFISWDYLWNLENDAVPNVLDWQTNSNISLFKGSHTGFLKLPNPTKPIRSILLDHSNSNLFIYDSFVGDGGKSISIPFHFHPDVRIIAQSENEWDIKIDAFLFKIINFSKEKWEAKIHPARISFSYGTFKESSKLVFTIDELSNPELKIGIISMSDNQNCIDSNYVLQMFSLANKN
jgi:uncharacterized heparinase superfamily protein